MASGEARNPYCRPHTKYIDGRDGCQRSKIPQTYSNKCTFLGRLTSGQPFTKTKSLFRKRRDLLERDCPPVLDPHSLGCGRKEEPRLMGGHDDRSAGLDAAQNPVEDFFLNAPIHGFHRLIQKNVRWISNPGGCKRGPP